MLAGGLWRVSADENQLESALLNLAVNARDAMQGGGKLTIETANAYLDEAYVRSEEEVKPGQYVMVAVSDTGSGMSKEVLDRVFEPFFTTKEIGQGTGLGLSMVYGFVKQSGGHVKIYSEVGAGNHGEALPAAPVGPDRRAADPPAHRRACRAATAARLVLVVEDEDDVRTLTVETLRELGLRRAGGGRRRDRAACARQSEPRDSPAVHRCRPARRHERPRSWPMRHAGCGRG